MPARLLVENGMNACLGERMQAVRSDPIWKA